MRLLAKMFVVLMAAGAGQSAFAAGVCRSTSFEGEVAAGTSFVKPIGNGMVFDLEAVRAGWIMRVLPAKGARPEHDAAELATPPYNSVTPLALTTDFSFRAQDVVAWNPRRFQYAADIGAFSKLQTAYEQYLKKPEDVAVQNRLAELAAASLAAELQILDAKLIPGTANQAQMAATVASHFSQTPHTVEQGGSVLGAVTWVKFRVTLFGATGPCTSTSSSLKAVSR